MPIKRSSGRLPPVNTRKTYESPVISPPIIKHCTFPVVPKFSSLSFLLLSLILCVISTIIQYVNLYKTVWWLPNSSIEYAIEFDLIDYHGLAHILFMLCTPYLYFMLIKIIPSFILTSFVISSILGFFIFAIWSYVMLWIVNRIQYSGVTILHNISGVLLLTYFPALTLLTYHFRYLEKAVSRCTRRQQQYYHSTANNVNNNHQKTLSRSSFVSLKGFLQIISSCLRRSIAIFTDWPCLSSKNIFFHYRIHLYHLFEY
ncbi:unnamed protein product [Heterobilharzia americana]|nr:unnamed protein product [Heterobilharzia americana]